MRSQKAGLCLSLCFALACSSTEPAPRPQPTGTGSAAATAAPSGSGQVELGPSLGGGQAPAAARFRVHLPGADANRHLTATVTLGLGAESTVTGCVSSVGGTCSKTQRVVLTAADHAEYLGLWKEVYAMPRCEPAGRFPGDREFRIDGGRVAYEDFLPAVTSDLPARTKAECEAPRRLVWWLARRMQAL